MMTIQNIGDMLDMIASNYGEKFLDGIDRKKVIKTWAVMFKDDDPVLVMQGVKNCLNTLSYRPTIADIRKRMSQAQMKGQMTVLEAFQMVSSAVKHAYSRYDAVQQFKALPPIIRKLVGTPEQLRDWHIVDPEKFQTIIMPLITRSYRELAQREFEYYALPADLKKVEQWRIATPSLEELPEPEKQQTVGDILDEMDRKTKEYREMMGLKPNPAYASRVEAFIHGKVS